MKFRLLLSAATVAALLAGCALQDTGAPIFDRTGQGSATATTSPVMTGQTYVVQPGDTLYRIAKSLNTSVHNLIPEKDEIEEKDYKLICSNCNYNVSIPKEIGKILTILTETNNIKLPFTCPHCKKKKM